MRKPSKIVLAGVAAGALAVGVLGGAAVATVPTLLAPSGLRADSGVATEPIPTPDYRRNESGETYGSATLAPSPELEPDLIAAIATNDAHGYVKKSELEAVDGTAAQATFKSPEDAVAWQNARARGDVAVAVYAVDGKTVIGEFLVTAPQVTER